MSTKDLLSLILALIALVGVAGGLWNRHSLRKGIGSQFLRYIALVVALPLAAAIDLPPAGSLNVV